MGGIVTPRRRRGWKWFAAIAVVLVGGAAAQLYYGPPAPKPATPAELAARDAYQQNLTTLAAGQLAIRSMLKDPDSARFGQAIGRVKHGQAAACGYVNSRNSFGGYTGATRWIVLPDKNVALIRESSRARFDKLWNRYCVGESDDGQEARN